ncbi:MAG: 16S rRNA (guanine(966)-N(2))-methyltransferase RsmD [Bacteroidota bacterium]
MRIIGGKYKGRQVHAPKGLPVRPTTDQAKEGLFNILRHRMLLGGARVLDCFAGTGNMSYEFLSRGAAHVTAVDRHPGCLRFIRTQFAILAPDRGHTVKSDVLRFLQKDSGVYDIIFLDPPYAMAGQAELVATCFRRNLLREGGWLILEHATREDHGPSPYFVELRRYGSSAFSIYQYPDSAEA